MAFTLDCFTLNLTVGVAHKSSTTPRELLSPLHSSCWGATSIMLLWFWEMDGMIFGVWDTCPLASYGAGLFFFGMFWVRAFSLVYMNTTELDLSTEQ